MNEIQFQVISDQRKEVEDMISYLTQTHIFFKYSKSHKKVQIVYFTENLQKLNFEISKKTRKVVMSSDIYYSEPGFSKELQSQLATEDLKSLFGMKIITKKRVIELGSMHRGERDTFVKHTNSLIQIMKEWKSTRGLRLFVERSLVQIDPIIPLPHYETLEFKIIEDLLNDLISKIEIHSLVSAKKQLYIDLELIKYENQYLSGQCSLFETQLKDKDRVLEGTQTTYTYLQHKFYLRSIYNKSEKLQGHLASWKKILVFLGSSELIRLKGLNRFFCKLVNSYLANESSWQRLAVGGLKPRKVLWSYYLQKFHPNIRSRSIHYSAEVLEEIRKDVYRGLPDRFKEVEEALRTICSLNSEVGYCQGMQLVTHFLFTIFNDGEEVVETLKTLMEPPYFMGELWKNGFCRLKLAIFQLEHLVSIKIPYLLEHLQKIEINLDIIVTPWIVTVFTYMMYQQKISVETVKHIWDLFIVSGWPILISTSLSLLYLCQDKIIGKSLEETLNAFSSAIPEISIKSITKFSVDPVFLDQLETSFNLQNT